MNEDLKDFLRRYCRSAWGESPEDCEPLATDGSERMFIRVKTANHSLVALDFPAGRSTGENHALVAIARHLRTRGVRVPTVYRYREQSGWIVMEDLGDLNLQHALRQRPQHEGAVALYQPVLDLLVDFQIRGARGFRTGWCYQGSRYDIGLMLERESGYFLRSFLEDYLGWSGMHPRLMGEFQRLANLAARAPTDFLVHRDFQSRNILFPEPGNPYVIDFQGARWGPPQYDLAALLMDPYAGLEFEVRKELLASYLDRLAATGWMGPGAFLEHFPVIALHRNMQILGAFAYLGRTRGKTFFLQWIPGALDHFRQLLDAHPELPCPRLRDLVEQLWERHLT
jgi:aminoglycoside/choline kinase family phosphotransferase